MHDLGNGYGCDHQLLFLRLEGMSVCGSWTVPSLVTSYLTPNRSTAPLAWNGAPWSAMQAQTLQPDPCMDLHSGGRCLQNQGKALGQGSS